MRESHLQAQILDYLKEHKIYAINIYGAGRTAKGAPDIIACYKGKFIAIECKVGDNSLEPAQVIHRKRIIASGGYHLTPFSFEEFFIEFNKIKRR